MRPTDALQLQRELRDNMRTAQWEDFMQGFIEARYGFSGTNGSSRRNIGKAWCMAEVGTLSAADTFLVKEHMTRLVEAAARDMPDDRGFEPEDPPALDGFIIFEKAPQILAMSGDTPDAGASLLPISAMSWTVVGEVGKTFDPTDVMVDRDADDVAAGLRSAAEAAGVRFEDTRYQRPQPAHPRPEGAREWTRLAPVTASKATPIGIIVNFYVKFDDLDEIPVVTPEGKTWDLLDAHNKARAKAAYGPYTIQHTLMTRWNRAPADVDDWTSLSEIERDASTSPVRLALATWLLMQQQIVDVTSYKLAPKAAATMRRKRMPSNISVVTLRRRKGAQTGHPDGAAFKYTHRWTVRGHWRKQPYGPGRAQTRLIYIHPYIKGPEDAPLVDRPRVSVLTR